MYFVPKLKSVNILCEIHFTHVFMNYALWPNRFCLRVFDTKSLYCFAKISLKFVDKFLFDSQKNYYLHIWKENNQQVFFFVIKKIVWKQTE